MKKRAINREQWRVVMTFKCLREEKEEWLKRAEECGMTLSAWIVGRLNKEILRAKLLEDSEGIGGFPVPEGFEGAWVPMRYAEECPVPQEERVRLSREHEVGADKPVGVPYLEELCEGCKRVGHAVCYDCVEKGR